MKQLIIALVVLIFCMIPVEAHASKELADHEQFKGEVRVEMEPWFGNYTYEDLYLLAHIINAEAGGGTSYISDQCVFGVGSVVLNRVKDHRFPNTIREVLWQPGQYYNGWHGAITREPVDRSWQIAAELLEEGPIFPPEVVWQANFTQGRGTYLYTDGMYFCY